MPLVGTQRTVSSFLLGAFAVYKFVEGSGQQVFNKVGSSTPFLPNLLSTGEQLAAGTIADQWTNAGSVTSTDFQGPDPNGGNAATRVQLTSNGAFLYYQPSLAAGTYTFSVYVKSNTGVSQTLRAGHTGFPLSITATTSWQRFHNSFTLGSPAVPAIAAVWEDASNNPVDVLVYGVQLEAGASMSAYTAPELDLQLGQQPIVDGKDPGWNSTGQDLSGGGYNFGISSAGHTVSQISVYGAVKQTASDLASGMEPIVAEIYGTLKMLLMGSFKDFGAISNTRVPSFLFGGNHHVDAYGVTLNDGKWHVFCGTYDGTTLRLYMDGVEVASQVVSISPVAINRLYAGRIVGRDDGTVYFPGSIGYAAVCANGHPVSQVRSNSAGIAAAITNRGGTVNVIDKWLAFEGDSLSDPNGAPPPSGRDFTNGWVYMLLRNLSPILQARNFALSGSSIAPGTLSIANPSRYQLIDATYDSTRSKNILTVFIGANDMNSGITAASFVSQLKTYCLARRAVGWLLNVVLPLPQTVAHAGVNAKKDAIIALMLADPDWQNGNAAHVLSRTDLESHIGPNAAAEDTTLYSDGEHLTALANGYLWPVVNTALATLI